MELLYDKTVVALLMLSQYFGHSQKECVSYYECILKNICSEVKVVVHLVLPLFIYFPSYLYIMLQGCKLFRQVYHQ